MTAFALPTAPAAPIGRVNPDERQLNHGEIRSWQVAPGRTFLVKGWRGHAWVTMEGDLEDYHLAPGDELEFCGPGLLVVEALGNDVIYDWKVSH